MSDLRSATYRSGPAEGDSEEVPKRQIPTRVPTSGAARTGLLELDRFSEASLEKWNEASQDLDELNASQYFGTEPERRRHRSELLDALRGVGPVPFQFSTWVRAVTYRFSLAPLSSAGSLQDIGGRFNAGVELDEKTLAPWPALYIAEDFETAFREKFQLASDSLVNGLTPQDMALQPGASMSVVQFRGRLSEVFDLTSSASLAPAAKIFRRIEMPAKSKRLMKKLGLRDADFFMLKTARQLFDAVLKENWRAYPRQFGLPAASQTLAELIRAAGYEAILYQSSKGPGKCLAVFPDRLLRGSFVELADAAPQGVKHERLDNATAAELCGWDAVAPQFRART